MGLFKPKLNPEVQKNIDRLNPKVFIAVNHEFGLPFAENMLTQVYYTDDKVVFTAAGMTVNLGLEKIIDISIKTDVEISNQYISSAGGAVAGALILGPLGAAIGGRVKAKKDRQIREYLIFTYNSESVVKQIAMDVTFTPKAREMQSLFAKQNKANAVIDL